MGKFPFFNTSHSNLLQMLTQFEIQLWRPLSSFIIIFKQIKEQTFEKNEKLKWAYGYHTLSSLIGMLTDFARPESNTNG